MLTHSIITFAQTPTPVLTIGQSYSPYSRLATDPVTFACSFTYPTATYYSLSVLFLDFKYSTSTTAASSDTLVARILWSSFSYISSGVYTSSPTTYTSRITIAKISDTGAFKNYSVTLGISGSSSTPNYYTVSDVGYYYCSITDISTATGSSVYLAAYCMF